MAEPTRSSLPVVSPAPALHTPTGSTTPRSACPAAMASLSGGTYKMGELGNTVTVQPFCLDVTEVTAAAYAQCVESTKCNGESLRCSPAATFGVAGKADHPINCVDWKQAAAYCKAFGKRLPTEEEWEWAARGQSGGAEYPWGAGYPDDKVCWSGRKDRSGTCKVGEFAAGDAPGGIHDLAGNVWEWTASPYNPRGKARVNRGGGWISNAAADLRASNRYADDPTNRTGYDGFRCAL